MKQRVIAVTASALVSTLAAWGTPAGASAAPGSMTGSVPSPVVLGPGCLEVPVTYAIEIPSTATDWGMQIYLNAPDGARFGYELVGAFKQSPTSGTVLMESCLDPKAVGTYTLAAQGTYEDASGTVRVPMQTLGTLENVEARTSSVALKAKRGKRGTARHRVIRAKAKLTLSSTTSNVPAGTGNVIEFQRLRRGAWKSFASTKTNDKGVAKVRLTSPKKVKIRAVYAGSGEALTGQPMPIAGSESATRKVKRA